MSVSLTVQVATVKRYCQTQGSNAWSWSKSSFVINLTKIRQYNKDICLLNKDIHGNIQQLVYTRQGSVFKHTAVGILAGIVRKEFWLGMKQYSVLTFFYLTNIIYKTTIQYPQNLNRYTIGGGYDNNKNNNNTFLPLLLRPGSFPTLRDR